MGESPFGRLASGTTAFFIGAIVCGLLATLAIVALIHPPQNPSAMNIANRFLSPTWHHLMGTDEYGRDLYSRDTLAVANSFMVAAVAVAIGVFVGMVTGSVAGYLGGWTGEIFMRIMDAAFAFPHLILSMLILTVLGPGRWPVALAIGIFNIPMFARLTQAAVLEGKEQLYVKAAQCMGGRWNYILRRHVLFYAGPTLLVQATSSLSGAVLAEAALSFLGLGIQPPSPSLGEMLSTALTYVSESVWLAIFPGITLLVIVVGFNLLGDGLEGRFGRW